VGRYSIPFATVMMISGLRFAPSAGVRAVCALLLLFAVVFNLAAVQALQNDQRLGWLRTARVRVNFANNLIIVYLLWHKCPSAWLLLALTPLAVAVYDSRAKTFTAALAASTALFVLAGILGNGALREWDAEVIHAAFIFSISLMINDLSRMLRERAGAI
ncbi:MAG TPA: hypothetical protein VNI01_13865, partial [Elusimicrobiota bacterium]|nr:hypothetical protein [Elusimicrobiota bacterium]